MSHSAPPSLEQLRAELVRYSHKIAAKGWVANHDGNLSIRVGEDRFLCTPTAVHKADITHDMLLVVGLDGAVKEGARKPFSEWELHRAVYEARSDVAAVVHAHPVYATAMAVARAPFGPPIMAEAVVSLGAKVPTVEFFPPKSPQLGAAVREVAQQADACLLASHGVLAFGGSLELAYLRCELVEHQAQIRAAAKAFGGAQPLAPEVVEALLKARHAAGLFAPRERAEAGGDSMSSLIDRVVQEELARLART